MPTLTIETSRKPKNAACSKNEGRANPAAPRRKIKLTPAAIKPSSAPLPEERITKQERVLTLLSRSNGAGIDEIMEATGWQQHSVRGFFAGTVKKKLGLNLTSTKADGDVRRYRVEKKRGR